MRLLVTALGLALVFYGAIVVLAACKVSATTLNDISAYRTVFHQLSSITAEDITVRDRVIVAAAGVACLIVFTPLAWRAIPRPYLVRTTVGIDDPNGHGHGHGATEVAPRAVERCAELAAAAHPSVADASARCAIGSVDVRVQLIEGDELRDTLRAVQQRIRDAATTQGLPDQTIDVTLAGLASPSKGDLL